MFKQRTLFIVGAGASYEADLPVGIGLAKEIANLLLTCDDRIPDLPGSQLLRLLYDKIPQRENVFHRAAVAIREGVVLTDSIDDFLNRHSNDAAIQLLGKAAIVRIILAAESQSKFVHNRSGLGFNLEEIENTWFVKFFRMLGSEVSKENVASIFDNVAFVVFNYDRCLEFFLYHALQRVYRISGNEARAIVGKCHIIHPYGKVAPLDFQGSDGVPFGDTHDWDFVTLAQGVSTYTERIDDAKMLNNISEEMSAARQIVFLGFGYNRPNMELLTGKAKATSKPVFGTALKLSGPSTELVRHQIGQMFTPRAVAPLDQIVLTDTTCSLLFDFHGRRLPN
jgi:hypothetical protein